MDKTVTIGVTTAGSGTHGEVVRGFRISVAIYKPFCLAFC